MITKTKVKTCLVGTLIPVLSGLLLKAGFASVRRWDWRETEHAEIDDYSQAHLPHMDKENGRPMSLNLEAVK